MTRNCQGINLSIIIPHYNSTDLLKGLIGSVPKREDVEILLIDDNSTIHSERLKEIAESRPEQIRLFYNEPGKNSAGACRNIGLEQAVGKWLLFADADDYFLPGFYEKVSVFFESEFDIIWFVPTSWNLNLNKPSNRHVRYEKLVRAYLETKGVAEEVRLRYNQKEPVSKLIRRQIVEDNGIRFDTTMVSNDVMFSMRTAYAADKITASEDVIYCETRMKGTLTSDANPERFFIRMEVFVNQYHFLKERLNRQEWKTLDLLGRPYIEFANNYGLSKSQVRKVYFYLLKKRVRIYVSRKWTLRYIAEKVVEKFR